MLHRDELISDPPGLTGDDVGFAQEDQLLIRCSRVILGDEAKANAAQLLWQPLDWDYILEASIRHGVSPLFYQGLRQVASAEELSTLVPARALAALARLYRNTRTRNRRLYRTLGEICLAFDKVGIPLLGLKDLHLARDVYPDSALRPLGDIDVLIHREDYTRASACLAHLGFVPVPDADIPFTIKYAWAHHFRRPADDVWVDLQWGIMQREWDVYREGNVPFDVATMWHGASLLRIDAYRILVPRLEDMLYHLCLHLEGHEYCELILFCDIAELLRRYGETIDWAYVVQLTKRCKAESSVYYVLLLVQRLFDVALPVRLLDDLEPAYFPGTLLNPLFGNLNNLHLSLDALRRSVAPPHALVREWETVVRRQTLGAMQAYRVIDQLATALVDAGGAVAILEGAPSQREYPDAALPPFEDIQLLVLDRDLDRMHNVLVGSGFTRASAPGMERYDKRWEVASSDPVLAGQPTQMLVRVDMVQGCEAIRRYDGITAVSKRDAAVRSIKARLGGHSIRAARIPLRIQVTALSPEALLLHLAESLGRRRQGRLFGLCVLHEFFRRQCEPLDWRSVALAVERAAGQQEREWIREGLLTASGFVGHDPECRGMAATLVRSAASPRILEWARYDPTVWGRYTAYRDAFFYLFTLLSIAGFSGKLRYIVGSLRGNQSCKPVLPRIIHAMAASALERRRQRNSSDFAYWIKPEGSLDS